MNTLKHTEMQLKVEVCKR